MWIDQAQYKVLGLVLAEARELAQLTQDDLAARLGKPQSFVSDYERGQRRIDVLELIRIGEELDASPMDIMAEAGRRLRITFPVRRKQRK